MTAVHGECKIVKQARICYNKNWGPGEGGTGGINIDITVEQGYWGKISIRPTRKVKKKKLKKLFIVFLMF